MLPGANTAKTLLLTMMELQRSFKGSSILALLMRQLKNKLQTITMLKVSQ
jgi:hypothetical protein